MKVTYEKKKPQGWLEPKEIAAYIASSPVVIPTSYPMWENKLTDEVVKIVRKNPGKALRYSVSTWEYGHDTHGYAYVSSVKSCGGSIRDVRKFANSWMNPRLFTILIETVDEAGIPTYAKTCIVRQDKKELLTFQGAV